MIVRPVNNEEEFITLAEKQESVFLSRPWIECYGDDLRLMGIYNDTSLIGGFYYLHTKRLGLAFIKLPPYTPYCGFFLKIDSSNQSGRNGRIKEAIASTAEYFSGLSPALTVLAFPPDVVDLQPFIWRKFKVVPNYTYRVDLTKDADEIRGNYDPKNRNAISKAQKEGVEVKINEPAASDLLPFFLDSLRQAGANVYEKELTNIFTRFARPSNSFSFSGWHQGQMVGAVFCIRDNKTCYYLLGGTERSRGLQGVNNLLVHRAIEHAKEQGCRVFDFEGSMLKGVEKFFRGFGGELVPFYTINKAKLGLEILLKFKKRELF